jgi:pheromone shutdown protein TraB
MEERDAITVKGSRIYFVDVVRGLKSEATRVKLAIQEVKPDLIAMSVSKEEIDGLRDYIKEPYEVEMSRYEELYSQKLSRFGDVFLPPPCFLAGLEEAENNRLELVGVDMDDETHTTAYCALVSGSELFRHTTRFNLLKLKSFRADTPADFVKVWDRKVNNLYGFRELEKERERFMAKDLTELASVSKKKILAVLDTERAEGVRALLVESIK